MRARLSLIILCAVLSTGTALAKDKTQFACEGVFGADSSEALLIKTYGAENVLTGETDGPEGTQILTTRVFPNDPERVLVFSWWDEENRKGVNYLDLPPSISGPHGVRVGMTVAEVEAINGEPFSIGGFWWDYGGYGMIDSGKLFNEGDGCYTSLRFAPADKDFGNLDVSSVSGEVTVPSSDPLLAKIDTRLQVLSISYAGPEGSAEGGD